MATKPKVSVYITSYNYAKYLPKAVESVLHQTYPDWELIIVDDGSTDNTPAVLEPFGDLEKVHVVHQKNMGLADASHRAIQLSKGEFVMRLDADDYLDENALLVLVKALEKNPDVDLVYPDYYLIDSEGKVTDHVRRKRIDYEVKLLDLPAHGACTMIRKQAYEELRGYSKNLSCQDGYDLWIKFIQRFRPYNVNLPLFYYRMHGQNITSASKRILEARKEIKQQFVEREFNSKNLHVAAIIPSRGSSHIYPDLPIRELNGLPLIGYAIKAAQETEMVNHVIVTTEDDGVAKVASEQGARVIKRPERLAKGGIEGSVIHVLKQLKEEGVRPDVVVLLYPTSPLLRGKHINEAINSLLIFNADSVISVKENRKFQYRHGKQGLEPLFEERLLKQERDMLYEETGSLIATKRSSIGKESILGERLGHVLLSEDESIDIHSKYHFWLAEQILKNKEEVSSLGGAKMGHV